jgi:hypothetical protein
VFAEKCILESLEKDWLVKQGLRSRVPVYQWNGGPSKLSNLHVPQSHMECHGTYVIEAVLEREGEPTVEAAAALRKLDFPENNRFVGATGVRDCGKVRHGVLYRAFLLLSWTLLRANSQNSVCVDVRWCTREPFIHVSTNTTRTPPIWETPDASASARTQIRRTATAGSSRG